MSVSQTMMMDSRAAMEAAAGCTYREFPSASRAILCTWTLRVGAGQLVFSQRVIPDGCVDVVWLGGEDLHVAGPATCPLDVPISAGTTVAGVRFRPGATRSALGERPRALLNQHVPLRDVLPRMADTFFLKLDRAPTATRACAIMEETLAERADTQATDEVVLAAVAEIAGAVELSVPGLATHVGLSERQLRRRFEDAVGYGPKMFHRVMRLQRACRLLRSARGRPDLCAVALETGYADQAHMTRECAELAGHSPAELVTSTVHPTLEMADFFKTPGADLRYCVRLP